jgi:hypothetical protein
LVRLDRPVSFDSSDGDCVGKTLADLFLLDENTPEGRIILAELINRWYDHLTDIEKRAVVGRASGVSFVGIASEYKVTKQSVHEAWSRAVNRLVRLLRE